jgi:hypothetical protein
MSWEFLKFDQVKDICPGLLGFYKYFLIPPYDFFVSLNFGLHFF